MLRSSGTQTTLRVITRLIGDVRHIAVGNASPVPATAALLARERGRLNNLGTPYVSLLGSRKHTFWTDGARELFDCAGQGRIDVFFLSGGQIDGEANINLVSVGDYERPKARFPGSFGSSYLYYIVPKVILFRLEHSRRTLVEKVDFISAPGWAERLAHLSQRHEVLAVRLYDPLESELPDLGLLTFQDAETGEQMLVDTHDAGFRKRFAQAAERREKALRAAFRDSGVDALELSTDEDLVDALMRFAGLRKRRSRIKVNTTHDFSVA